MTINDIQITFATSTNNGTRLTNRVADTFRGLVSGYVDQYQTPGAVDRLRWVPTT